MPRIEILKQTDDATFLKVQATVFDPDRPYDLTGEYFVPETDFGDDVMDKKFALYDHAANELQNEFAAYAPANPVLGAMKFLEKNDRGRWFELELKRANEYHDFVMELHRLGLLGASSRTLPNLKSVDAKGKITRWIEVEVSLTPTPAEARTAYTDEELAAVKSAFKTLAVPHLKFAEVIEPVLPPPAPAEPAPIAGGLQEKVDQLLGSVPALPPTDLPELKDDPLQLEINALKEKNTALETQIAEMGKSILALAGRMTEAETSVTKSTTFMTQRLSDIVDQTAKMSNAQRIANGLPPLAPSFTPPPEPPADTLPARTILKSAFGDSAPGSK